MSKKTKKTKKNPMASGRCRTIRRQYKRHFNSLSTARQYQEIVSLLTWLKLGGAV
jgi:hypothetical protein